MTYGPYEQIAVDVRDRILTLTLNRPEKLNAFTGTMMSEMIDVFTKVNTDDEVRAVIVTGAGRAFCAGADLSAGASTFDATTNPARKERDAGPVETVDWSDERVRDGGGRVTLAIFECLKPVIAAVNGAGGRHRRHDAAGDGHPHRRARRALRLRVRAPRHRAGSGVELVPAAHRRHLPGAGMVLFGPRVRRGRGAEGRARQRARRSGGTALPRARAIAREIIDNTAPVSVALIRQMMWRGLGMDHPMEAHKVDSPRHLCARRVGRCARRREFVPREASAAFPGEGLDRHAALFPVVAGAQVLLTLTDL